MKKRVVQDQSHPRLSSEMATTWHRVSDFLWIKQEAIQYGMGNCNEISKITTCSRASCAWTKTRKHKWKKNKAGEQFMLITLPLDSPPSCAYIGLSLMWNRVIILQLSVHTLCNVEWLFQKSSVNVAICSALNPTFHNACHNLPYSWI